MTAVDVQGSASSNPTRTSSINAASLTVLVIGPGVSVVLMRGHSPLLLISPGVGLNPTRPQKEEGRRIEPPVSSPRPRIAKFAEIDVPVPLLDPPGSRERSKGFLVMPDSEDVENHPVAQSIIY
jgi:hypothetical protein